MSTKHQKMSTTELVELMNLSNKCDLPYTMHWVNITPELASILLENSDDKIQRKSSTQDIKKYAARMKAGQWERNGASNIVLDGSGNVINGFHRLKAVVLADVSVMFPFVTGISTEKIHSMDTGKSRTLTNLFEIKTGIKKYADFYTHAIKGFELYFQKGRRGKHLNGSLVPGGYTGKNIEKSLHRHEFVKLIGTFKPEMDLIVEDMVAIFKEKEKPACLNKNFYSTLFFSFWKHNEQYAYEFFYRLMTGLFESNACPIKALRNTLVAHYSMTDVNKKKQAKLNNDEIWRVVIFAWNKFVDAEEYKGFGKYKTINLSLAEVKEHKPIKKRGTRVANPIAKTIKGEFA